MSINAYLNDSQKVSVIFYGWPTSSSTPNPEEPDSVIVNIYNTETDPDTLISTEAPVNEPGVGAYSYTWTPTTVGEYNIQFFATFSDLSTDVSNNFFTAYESPIPPEGSATLEIDQILEFMGVITPLYLDPGPLIGMFPDASEIEVIELIHFFSNEVKSLLKLEDDEEPPFVAIEYIHAAVACSLSRIYDDMGMGDDAGFRLGDFSVNSRSFPKTIVTRANASTWCEIAAALRDELQRGNAGIRAIGKGRGGGDVPWPVPVRRLKNSDVDTSPMYYYDPFGYKESPWV